METKPPVPPFTEDSALQKVRMAEDAWNTRDPDRVVLVYTPDTRWRNRAEFPVGRDEMRQLLNRKWFRELDYRLIKELWAFAGNRIAVRFAYEWHDDAGQWFRSYLDEYVFRFNRRTSRSRGLLFYRLLEQAVATKPVTYQKVVGKSQEIRLVELKDTPHGTSVQPYKNSLIYKVRGVQ